jgi:hypothetical protein
MIAVEESKRYILAHRSRRSQPILNRARQIRVSLANYVKMVSLKRQTSGKGKPSLEGRPVWRAGQHGRKTSTEGRLIQRED